MCVKVCIKQAMHSNNCLLDVGRLWTLPEDLAKSLGTLSIIWTAPAGACRVLEAHTFWGGLGVSVGTFFGIWAAPRSTFLVVDAHWGTFWHQMASRTHLFEFWMRFEIHFGRLLGSRLGFGRSLGSLLVTSRRSLSPFYNFVLGKCESIKSVVLL